MPILVKFVAVSGKCEGDKMSFKEYVDFANTNKTCYLPTVEGDQPRVLLPVWRAGDNNGRHCAHAPFQRVHPVAWNRLGIGCRNVEEAPRGGALQQVAEVGALTSSAFVLTIESGSFPEEPRCRSLLGAGAETG